MNPVFLLSELVKFAARNGESIAGLVDAFMAENPELCEPPPEASLEEVDQDIDRMIERGEL